MTTDWSGTAEAYERSFARLCAGAVPAVVDTLGLAGPGEGAVLDAGTGTGAVSGEVASRGVEVVGVDADPGMVALARRRHAGIRFMAGRLPALAFDDAAFRAAAANFVVNHLPDPGAGIAELARVVRPNGRVAVTVWPARPVATMNRMWNEVIERSRVDRGEDASPPPGPDVERSVVGLAAALRDVGMVDVRGELVEWTAIIPAEDLWLGVTAGIATVGAVFRAQGSSGRHAMRTAFEEITGLGTLTLPLAAVLAVGRVRS